MRAKLLMSTAMVAAGIAFGGAASAQTPTCSTCTFTTTFSNITDFALVVGTGDAANADDSSLAIAGSNTGVALEDSSITDSAVSTAGDATNAEDSSQAINGSNNGVALEDSTIDDSAVSTGTGNARRRCASGGRLSRSL